MGKSQPAPPDPVATAAAQGGWNSFTAQQQQAMNMVSQSTPYGSLDYSPTGSVSLTDPSGKQITVPQYTATQTFSPSQKAIFDKTQEAQGNIAGVARDQSARIGELLSTPFKFDNHDAADWAYDLASSRILPEQERARAALERQLINRGLRPGTPAWAAEMTRMDQANTDQMNQLALTGRGQAFKEAAFTRANPINETSALLSGSQVTQPGQTFTSTPQTQVGGVDYTGLVNNNYNQQVAANNAQMGGLGGLFGTIATGAMKYGPALIAASDRRLKSDIVRVGELPNGLSVYDYTIFGRRERGVMAQEVEQIMPEAVVMHPSGFKMVNYSMLGLA